jgi:hypothetical protein
MYAQELLAGHNRFKGTEIPVAPYAGRLDGQFGEQSASACARAKYLLGYPEDELKPIFGSNIFHYLTDTRLPLEYQQRRVERYNTTPKEKALELALTQIGVKENPFGSNLQKYGLWYGMNGVPWCAIFASWCFAKSEKPLPRIRYSYVPTIVDDARAGRNGLSLTLNPQPGDLCTWTFGEPNAHVSIFEGWIGQENHTSLYSVSGNTGTDSQSNGGEVMKTLWPIYLVTHFVRVW